MTRPTPRRRVSVRCAGFTLLEVLVGLVVFSIGMLGVAGLAVHGSRLLSDAVVRSDASQAARQLVDSLWTAGVRTGGGKDQPWGRVEWRVVPPVRGQWGEVRVSAVDSAGRRLLALRAVTPFIGPVDAPLEDPDAGG